MCPPFLVRMKRVPSLSYPSAHGYNTRQFTAAVAAMTWVAPLLVLGRGSLEKFRKETTQTQTNTQIGQTASQATRQLQRICLRIGIRMVYAVCQRQRQEKFQKAGVARMRARMKHEAREKVDTSSTNTDLQPIPRWSLLISSSATESCPPLGEYSRK